MSGGSTVSDENPIYQAHPHAILILLPIILYGINIIYSNFVVEDKVELKAYCIFVYLSFILLLIGYSRYCTAKIVQGGEMIFMISAYLMLSSISALTFYFYKIIKYEE